MSILCSAGSTRQNIHTSYSFDTDYNKGEGERESSLQNQPVVGMTLAFMNAFNKIAK